MMRILFSVAASRPNGGADQPTSIWPDMTWVKVGAGPPVATGFAAAPVLAMNASTSVWVEAPLVE